MRRTHLFLLTLVILALLAALYEGILYWHAVEPSEGLLVLHSFVFLMVLIFWVDADSRHHAEIYRPFEYGYLAFLFWLPYLPYYLWRTRGAMGLLMLGAFAALFFMSDLVRWIMAST